MTSRPGWRLRLLSLLPAACFVAHHRHHLALGAPADSLWMCHVSTLTLAVGLLLGRPALIRLAVIWIVPGIPIWAGYMCQTADAPPTTFVSHLTGLAVGLIALRAVGMDRRTWWLALLWYLGWQHVCRLWTPAAMNINIAHRAWDGWEQAFPDYRVYWLATTLVAAVVLWILGRALERLLGPAAVSA